jgi:hypothetical protein
MTGVGIVGVVGPWSLTPTEPDRLGRRSRASTRAAGAARGRQRLQAARWDLQWKPDPDAVTAFPELVHVGRQRDGTWDGSIISMVPINRESLVVEPREVESQRSPKDAPLPSYNATPESYTLRMITGW